MNIKQLLELGNKQTIFGTDTRTNTFGTWGGDNKAFIKASPEAFAKLREMIDMLPSIKTGLSIMEHNPDMMECERNGARQTLAKIKQWENN